MTKKIDIEQCRFELLTRLGDSALIMGHRLSEWSGDAPTLEEDMAMSNIALDLIGQARLWLTAAAQAEGAGRTEDDLAYQRDVRDWRNLHLVELPNGDFGRTMLRQYFFDAYHLLVLEGLSEGSDREISGIAAKSLKEVRYHLRHSSGWVVRLGDGTQESHRRMVNALDICSPWLQTKQPPPDAPIPPGDHSLPGQNPELLNCGKPHPPRKVPAHTVCRYPGR